MYKRQDELFITGEVVVVILGLDPNRFHVQLFIAEVGHAQTEIHGGIIVVNEQVGVQTAGGLFHAGLLVGRIDLPALGLAVIGDSELGQGRAQLCLRHRIGQDVYKRQRCG